MVFDEIVNKEWTTMSTSSTWTGTLRRVMALAALLFGTQIASAQEYCLSSSTNQETGTGTVIATNCGTLPVLRTPRTNA